MAKAFDNNNFQAEVLNSDIPVLVDFWAPWCGPCRMMGPVIDEMAEEAVHYKVGKINVDENPELAIRFGVSSIPTVAVFENGQLLDTFVGYREKEQIAAFISAC